MKAPRSEEQPALSETLFGATDDVSQFFDEGEGRLPVFLGGTLHEHTEVWRALNRKDLWVNWRKAAIAASLVRASGQREGQTPIQEFARAIGVGPEHVSRLAATYRAFDQPDDPEITRLLADSTFSFKAFLVAATMGPRFGVQPSVALRTAKAEDWSANELARWLAKRKRVVVIDEENRPIAPADDDDDLEVVWRGMPGRVPRPPATRVIPVPLTERQEGLVRALAEALGTDESDHALTLLAVVERAAVEWVEDPAAGVRSAA